MDLPGVSWTQLALQIPLALVIVVLMVYVLRHLEKSAKDMLEFMANQAELWREFLRFQQELHNQGIARLAEEIKNDKIETVKEVAELTRRVDGVIDKAIMIERLLPDEPRRKP